MGLLAQLVIALALFTGGFAGGIKWHVGIVAERELEEQLLREADARQQRRFNDLQAGRHATVLASLNTQLGKANAKIARLSGRTCLDAGTVGVLNATGVLPGGTAPVDAASAPAAPAEPAGNRTSTDVDVAGYIALCRTRYAEIASQLNQILDIEERRHPPGNSSP